MTRPLLVLALLLPLAACGGSDAAPGASAKATYVKDASAVCTQARTEADQLTTPSDAAGLATAVDTLVGIGEKARTDLDALTPPPADAQALKTKVLDPFGALVTDGRSFADKVKAAGSDQTTLLPLLSQRPTGEGIDVDYLKSYGLTSCADLVTRLREG